MEKNAEKSIEVQTQLKELRNKSEESATNSSQSGAKLAYANFGAPGLTIPSK